MRLIIIIILLFLDLSCDISIVKAADADSSPSAAGLITGLDKANSWISHCSMTVHTILMDTGFYPYARVSEGTSEYREENGQIDLISLHHIRKSDGSLVFDSAKHFSRTRFIVNHNRRFEYEW